MRKIEEILRLKYGHGLSNRDMSKDYRFQQSDKLKKGYLGFNKKHPFSSFPVFFLHIQPLRDDVTIIWRQAQL